MTVELAREVAARIGTLDGVVAVTLGGSLARGRADPRSDVDLGLYYGPARPFSVGGLRALATELDDGHAPEVVGIGEWGPWINGGAWTRIRDTRVDLLYRLRGPDGPRGGRAGRPGLRQRLPVPGRRLPGAGAVRPERAWFLNEKGAVATLSGLGPEPAGLEVALQAMAALTATVRQTATSLDCR